MPRATRKKPGRPPDPALRERRREEILDAAIQLFAAQGYAGADLQVLADNLGIGKGTVYRYFPSKQELFLACVDHVVRGVRAAIDRVIAGIDDPLERIAAAIGAHIRHYAAHPQSVELLIQERALFKDRKKPSYFEHRDANVERWRALYRSLIAEGRLRDIPVERITDVICDLLYGTMISNYFNRDRKPLHEQVADVIDVFYHGILSDAERNRRGIV